MFEGVPPAGAEPKWRKLLPIEAAADNSERDDDRKLEEEDANREDAEDNSGAAIWTGPGDADEGDWLASVGVFALAGAAKAIVAHGEEISNERTRTDNRTRLDCPVLKRMF